MSAAAVCLENIEAVLIFQSAASGRRGFTSGPNSVKCIFNVLNLVCSYSPVFTSKYPRDFLFPTLELSILFSVPRAHSWCNKYFAHFSLFGNVFTDI